MSSLSFLKYYNLFYHTIFDISFQVFGFINLTSLYFYVSVHSETKEYLRIFNFGGIMSKIKDYIQLHLNILLFSLTSVFSKFASIQYNRHGLHSPMLYVFLFLMIANCGIYAIAWQQVIKKFSLSTAYANKSVYLLWSQIWAVFIFHESLSVRNIIGLLVVLFGVWMVQRYE